ncbi:MAG: DUF2508 family protein [Eubacteriales bacterium]
MKKKANKKGLSKALLEIQQELEHTRARIETVQNNYEHVLDHDLIDSYIFESNAAWKRYHFLLRQIRLLSTTSL